MAKLRLFVVALVASSAGLVSLYADASVEFVAIAVGVGTVLGAIVWWFLVQTYKNGIEDGRSRRGDFEKRERFK